MNANNASPGKLLRLAACLAAVCCGLALAAPVAAVPFQDWYQTTNGTDTAAAMAVDDRNNLLVTGKALVGDKYQGLTRKYSPTGVLLWSQSFAPGSFFDEFQPVSLALDGQGNVYVLGNLSAAGNPPVAYATIKYLADGTYVTTGWPKVYPNPLDGLAHQANAVVVNKTTGVVFVSGWMNNGVQNFFVNNAYYANGNDFWGGGNVVGGAAGVDGRPFAATVDASNNFYFTGSYGSAGGLDFYTAKIDASDPLGPNSWSKTWSAWLLPDVNDDIPRAIAVDSGGNVYVTGTFTSANLLYSGFVILKYQPNGVMVASGWPQTGDSNWDFFDEGAALALDSHGNVIFVGTVDDYGHRKQIITSKYAPGGGAPIWKRYYYPDYDVYGRQVVVDRKDNVYVAGQQALIKYRANGDLAWSTPILFTSPVGLALGDKRSSIAHVYVAGTMKFPFFPACFFSARYRQANALPYNLLLP